MPAVLSVYRKMQLAHRSSLAMQTRSDILVVESELRLCTSRYCWQTSPACMPFYHGPVSLKRIANRIHR
ncbi:hypothetical protein ACLK1T_18295 [Escherichia coli]